MNLRIFKFKILFGVLGLILAVSLSAQIPAGYYKGAEGKKAAELKTALYTIIRTHTQLEYYALSTTFRTTDWNPNGYFWDMYSSVQRSSWTGLNREHNMPKSWFGVSSDQVNSYAISSDVHNLYPSDAAANTAKSNYPPGEVSTSSFDNGVFRVGINNFSGYSGKVFEPADYYKGDFARDYMYMVTCYEDYATVWQSLGTASVLSRNTYPVFSTYGVNLLLKWHRNDPVSEKEINRNDAVYSVQHNRNPFVDHPELAEYIWGKYMGAEWHDDGILPEEETNFKLKPNPAKTQLSVNVNKPELSTYFIKTLSGITVKTSRLSADGIISIAELTDGMYLLELYNVSTRNVGKFIVCH